MSATTIDCPQCQHWDGEVKAPGAARIAVEGCGLCDGTGLCEPFHVMHGYSWEGDRGPDEGRSNVDMCVDAILEYGACSVGQMAHMAPNRHAEHPFTKEQVKEACARPEVAGIVEEAG